MKNANLDLLGHKKKNPRTSLVKMLIDGKEAELKFIVRHQYFEYVNLEDGSKHNFDIPPHLWETETLVSNGHEYVRL